MYVCTYVCVVILLSLSYSNMLAPMLKAVGFGACANDGKTMTHYFNLPEVRMLHESHACHMHVTCMSHAHHMHVTCTSRHMHITCTSDARHILVTWQHVAW